MNFKVKPSKILLLINQWKWVILGTVSLLIRWVANSTPQYVESIYSRGIYPFIRWVFDNSLGLLPFPLIYFFYACMLYFIIKTLAFFFKKAVPLSVRIRENIFSVLSFSGFMIFWFLVLWGYNYARTPFHKQMNITIFPLDTAALRQELDVAVTQVINARRVVNNTIFDEKRDMIASKSTVLEQQIRFDVTRFLKQHGFVAGGRLRGRSISPEGIMLRFGISGIYMPYVGESNIDAGIHVLEKPFTMAHELAHGYGWTDEATANFIAYLTCISSDDPFVNYSGYLSYFRYVASNYRRIDADGYQKIRAQLPEAVINDLNAINNRLKQFPTWFDTDGLNNVYLKSQGVKEGTASYSRVVTLVHSWRATQR